MQITCQKHNRLKQSKLPERCMSDNEHCRLITNKKTAPDHRMIRAEEDGKTKSVYTCKVLE